MFYTKESQTSEIIAALLSLKTESKGKRFFLNFQPLKWHTERPLKLEDWRCDSLPSNLKESMEV